MAVRASSLNHLFACCAALLLCRSGQHAFHGGNLNSLGLVIAPELFVQSYCLGFLTVGKQLLGPIENLPRRPRRVGGQSPEYLVGGPVEVEHVFRVRLLEIEDAEMLRVGGQRAGLQEVDELAGDGTGLATVREAVDSMNGSLTIESVPGKQTTVSMVVPLHQAMQKALLVMAGGIVWGIPETGVQEVIDMNLATIAVTDHATILERSDGDIPFASFGDLMGVTPEGVPTSIVVATNAAGSIALGVEAVVGTRRVAAKELGAVLADVDAVTGAALLGGDEVVLLVDTTRLVERQHEFVVDTPAFSAAHVLIVDDSRGVQQVVSSALATSGFNTSVAASVADALGALHSGSFDAIVVDFSMPRADGVALAHMVRQRHGDIPMVMLSGVAEGDDVDRAREAGVDAFFGKADFKEGGLAEKLRELIGIRRAKEQTA